MPTTTSAVLDRNLNAALDIGEMRIALHGVVKGLVHPKAYFDGFDPGDARMGSHRNLGKRHVSILDDHDHVFGEKVRFSSEAASDHQVVAGVALQLLTLGIPCIYYGTEQALAGPEPWERKWLPEWKGSDRYLREAMFGPEHPRQAGRASLVPSPEGLDQELPGFGPFGTVGHHVFDEQSPTGRAAPRSLIAGDKAPALSFADLGGRSFRWDWGGAAAGGPRVVFFWGEGSVPSMEAMTWLDALARRGREVGLETVAVEATGLAAPAVAAAMERYRRLNPAPSFPVVADPERRIVKLFGPFERLPQMYLVALDGSIYRIAAEQT